MPKSIFETVKLQWGDETFEVAPNQVMGLIQRIEDHITFADLHTSKPAIGKISAAYAEALRYAGASVTDEEVYGQMFDMATGRQMKNSITGLLMIMIPPNQLQKKTRDSPVKPKPKNGKKKQSKKV